MSNSTSAPYNNLGVVNTASTVSYINVAFATLLVFDAIMCLPEEITYVWSRARNPRAWIYLINRYLPFVDTFMEVRLLTTVQPPDICARDFKILTWMIVIGIIIAEVILMQRTYAIYEQRKGMLVFLCILMAILVIPSFVVVKLELDSIYYGFPRHGPYQGCTLIADASVIIMVAYVLILLSETVIVALTLYKAIHELRVYRSPLVVNLYRNGLMYYAYTLVISLANVIMPIAGPDYLTNSLAIPQHILHSILCARMLLSILRDGNLNAHGTSLLSELSVAGGLVLRASRDVEASGGLRRSANHDA